MSVAAGAELPFVDAHSVTVGAEPEVVWDVITRRLLPRLGGPAGPSIARLLGCSDVDQPQPGSGVPPAVVGFRVSAAVRPSLIALEGEHRFARYALIFRIEPINSVASRLTAQTRADFPGLRGRIYRALVIGTRGHVIVVRRLLRSVKRGAEPAHGRPGARGVGRVAAGSGRRSCTRRWGSGILTGRMTRERIERVAEDVWRKRILPAASLELTDEDVVEIEEGAR